MPSVLSFCILQYELSGVAAAQKLGAVVWPTILIRRVYAYAAHMFF